MRIYVYVKNFYTFMLLLGYLLKKHTRSLFVLIIFKFLFIVFKSMLPVCTTMLCGEVLLRNTIEVVILYTFKNKSINKKCGVH